MTQEQKTAAMQRARFNARENAAPTEVPSTTRVLAVASGKGGVGKSSVTVNLAAALAARGLTVGVLDADIWGFSVPRMLGVDGRLGGERRQDRPEHGQRRRTPTAGPPGTLKVVSMGFLVDDEGTALDVARPHPHQGARAVPHRRALGRAGLPAHRHAARHRRHPDGSGAHAAAGRDARRHHAGAARRRRSRPASPTWRGAPT